MRIFWNRLWPFLRELTFPVLGIVAGQAILYGPSLAGHKILLPLDFLAQPGVYLPAGAHWKPPYDPVLSDLVLLGEPSRRFIAAEMRAHRIPRWNPYQFAGAPFVVPKCSPFVLLGASSLSPVIVAWLQVFQALISGLGAYVFFRHVLKVSIWPATIAAWCYPLTGFFVLWAGYGVTYPVAWLPWILLAIHSATRRTSLWAGGGLALATFLVLVSGALDVAGQVLLASGLFAIWNHVDLHRRHFLTRGALQGFAVVMAGWALGFLLAAPDILPTLEYSRTGARMERRGGGEEERPPVGLAALPQIVLPDMYGSSERGSFPIFPEKEGNLLESASAAYTGILVTLLLAPLAWCSRRHRSINGFFVALALVTLSWCLDVPVLVDLLRLPGLNMMSHNRFVFAASFAILCMAAVGMEVIWQRAFVWRAWFWVPTALLGGLALWCMYRAGAPPEPIASQLRAQIAAGNRIGALHDLAGVREVEAWFNRRYNFAALLSLLSIGGWAVLVARGNLPRWVAGTLALAVLGDLLWFGHGRRPQCDPALYYPRIGVLEEIAKSEPGRVVGYNCLPARLAESHGLRDIRGYDAVDPARLMDLMTLAADPHSPVLPYSQTQWFRPRISANAPDNIRLSPILDMLGVRYVIFRGLPPAGFVAPFQGDDYWALINKVALPRVFIPRSVQTIADDRERRVRMSAPAFNPRGIAYVEIPVGLPLDCVGTAEIVEETSSNVKIHVKMETPGLVVLADLWDQGWRAYLDGERVPILRTNHAVRGVVVTAGNAGLEFRYEPQSVAWGLRLAGLAVGILAGWGGTIAWNTSGSRRTREIVCMKTLPFLFASLVCSCGAVEAQTADTVSIPSTAISGREGFTKGGTDVMFTHNGKTEKVTKEVVFQNGLRVNPDGTVILPNGEKTSLRNNQLLTLNGSIETVALTTGGIAPATSGGPPVNNQGEEVGRAAIDGITVSGNEALITQNGVTEKLAKEMRLKNGTRVQQNGEVTLPNGTQLTLRNDQVLLFDGRVIEAGARPAGTLSAPR